MAKPDGGSAMENVCRGKVTKIAFPREGNIFSSGGRKLHPLFFPFVYDVDSRGGQCPCPYIFPVEGLAQTKAGCDGAHNGDERIEDGYLANRVTAEQFVVKGKTPSGV